LDKSKSSGTRNSKSAGCGFETEEGVEEIENRGLRKEREDLNDGRDSLKSQSSRRDEISSKSDDGSSLGSETSKIGKEIRVGLTCEGDSICKESDKTGKRGVKAIREEVKG
jgi:hypothetical protein